MENQDDEFREDLGDVSMLVVDQLECLGRLTPQESLVVLTAALGVIMAHGDLLWSDEKWALLGSSVKQTYEFALLRDKPKIH